MCIDGGWDDNGPGRCTAIGTAINGYIRCKRTNQIQTSCRQPCTNRPQTCTDTNHQTATFLTLYYPVSALILSFSSYCLSTLYQLVTVPTLLGTTRLVLSTAMDLLPDSKPTTLVALCSVSSFCLCITALKPPSYEVPVRALSVVQPR